MKWKKDCGCVIDASETGSGILLCPVHRKEAHNLKDAAEIHAFIKKHATPNKG